MKGTWCIRNWKF